MQWVFRGVLKSCQQYRSDNGISPKPETKRFLIFRIELLILIDELSAHRTPPAKETKVGCGDCGDRIGGDVCELLHTSIKIILMEYQCSPGERDPASDSGSILKERLRLPSLAPAATAAGPRSKRGRGLTGAAGFV